MLKYKTEEFVKNAKEMTKRIHKTIMSDSLNSMDGETFELLQDAMKFIDQSLDLCKLQNETLVDINRKLDRILVNQETKG